jgi:hypothetical protein
MSEAIHASTLWHRERLAACLRDIADKLERGATNSGFLEFIPPEDTTDERISVKGAFEILGEIEYIGTYIEVLDAS